MIHAELNRWKELHHGQPLSQLIANIFQTWMSAYRCYGFQRKHISRSEHTYLNLPVRRNAQIVLLKIIVDSDNALLLLESFSQLYFHLIKFLHLTLIALKSTAARPRLSSFTTCWVWSSHISKVMAKITFIFSFSYCPAFTFNPSPS